MSDPIKKAQNSIERAEQIAKAIDESLEKNIQKERRKRKRNTIILILCVIARISAYIFLFILNWKIGICVYLITTTDHISKVFSKRD